MSNLEMTNDLEFDLDLSLEKPDAEVVSDQSFDLETDEAPKMRAYPVEFSSVAEEDFDSDTDLELPPLPNAEEYLEKLFRSSLMLIDNGDLSHAKHLLRNLLERDSKHEGAIYWLGYCFKQQGELESAQLCFKELNRLNPTPDNLVALAEVEYDMDNDQAAFEAYQEALGVVDSESPILFGVYKNLGNIFVRAGDFESGEEQYNRAYTLRPHSDTLMVNYGTLELQKGNFDLGQERFRDALKINEFNDKAWVGLALVNRLKADFTLAWGNLEHALDINILNKTALQVAFDWGIEDGRFEVAIKWFKRYLESFPEDEAMSLMLAQLLAQSGRGIEAKIEITRVHAISSANEGVEKLLCETGDSL